MQSDSTSIIPSRKRGVYISFGLLGVISLLLMAATVIEKLWGSGVAYMLVYGSPWTVALWFLTAAVSLYTVIRRRRAMNAPAFLIHIALLLILAGAAVTHFSSLQGSIRLDMHAPSDRFIKSGSADSAACALPFRLRLDSLCVKYYPGTATPADYQSYLSIIHPDGETRRSVVSMNNILSVSGYRFYQSAIGDSHSLLSVCHDPWGIAITYAGYILLALSMTIFLFSRRSRFRTLLRSLAVALLLLLPSGAYAADAPLRPAPPTIQKGLADSMGRLLVLHNGRVAPLQSLARDFCIAVCGSDSYRGMTAEQVLAGWLFYYDSWVDEPMIQIKGDRLHSLLGTDAGHVALSDFYRNGRFLPDSGSETDRADRNVARAIAVSGMISRVCTGSDIKIFPYRHDDGPTEWLSWTDTRPADMSLDEWKFVRGSMEYIAREIFHGRNIAANEAIGRIALRQSEILGGDFGPDSLPYKAERFYNRFSRPLPLAVCLLVAGLGVFFIFIAEETGRKMHKAVWTGVFLLSIAALCYVASLIALRWIIGGHLPLADGHDTMMAVAFSSLLLPLLLWRRLRVLRPGALIVAGLAVMVAVMADKSPAVTLLMPVLQSPLLSVHVMLVMLSYTLLALIAFNSIAGICMLRRLPLASRRLADISGFLLYPALFLLAAGIFTGAVWANVSWGRYWGWDPKETWALITFIIYSLPLHSASFPALASAKGTHIYLAAAFLSVLTTYFGVNFFLPGLHSYA